MTGPGPADDDAQHDSEPVGSVAEEAFKLFRAVASPATDGPTDGPTSDHVCSTGWCPVCQVVGVIRDHPEAVASVTQSAVALARSLRDLVDVALAPKEEQT